MGLQGDAPPAATQVQSAKQQRDRRRREEIHEQVVGGWRSLGQGIGNLGRGIASLPVKANLAVRDMLVEGQRQAWGMEDVPGPGPSLSEIAYRFATGDHRTSPPPPEPRDDGVTRKEPLSAQTIGAITEDQAFVASTQQRLSEAASNFKLFETLYAEGNLSPQAQAALDEAYEQAVLGVEQINDEINNKLAQLQAGQEILGVDPETGMPGPAEVSAAGMVPGVSGQRSKWGGTPAATAAIGETFERATARALQTQPNVQGTSGPFTFVRGGAESDAHRAMQEAQIRDFIGQADDLIVQGAGGQDYRAKADSLAREAAALQLDVLGIQDQNARMDMQLAFEQQLRRDIDDLVAQRQSIIDQFEDIEVALAEEDLAQGASKYALAFDASPEGAYLDAFETRMDEFLTQQGFEETVEGEYDAVMDVASMIASLDDRSIELLEQGVSAQAAGRPTMPGGVPDPNREELAELDPAQVQQLAAVEQSIDMTAKRFGLDPTEFKNNAIRARRAAQRIKQEIDNLGSAKRIEPGSHAAAYAIFQEAAPRLGEDAAQALANSPAMHRIIGVGSGGKVGAQKGGSIVGIGGLSRETYEAMGIDYDTIKGDLSAELGALIDYLIVAYGGDPVAALMDMRDSKVWGRMPKEAASPMVRGNLDLQERRQSE